MGNGITQTVQVRIIPLAILAVLLGAAGCVSRAKQADGEPGASAKVTPTTTAIAETRLIPLMQLGRGFASNVSRSADGKIAAFKANGLLKWYDATSLKQLGEMPVQGYEGPWSGVYFSPDDQLAVVDGIIGAQIVDLREKKIVGQISGGNGPSGGYRFSRDSQYLAYLIHDRTTGGPYESIDLWSRADPGRSYNTDGPYFSTLLPDRYHVMSAPAISPDGSLVAAGHSDKRIYVWDLRTSKTRFMLEGHAASVTCVDFSPDGSLLASGSQDGTIRLWNPKTGSLVRVITGFRDALSCLEFNSDGKALHVWIADGTEQSVDLRSGEISAFISPVSTPDPLELRQYEEGYASRNSSIFSRLLFSPDGRTLAVGGDPILLWDVQSQTLQRVLETKAIGSIRGMAFSPDGTKLAAATDGSVLAWNAVTGANIFTESGTFLSGMSVLYGVGDTELGPARGGGAGAEQGLAFSPDGTRLTFGNSHAIEVWDVTRSVKVMDLENPAGSYATQVSFSDDGTRLYAVLNRNRAAQVWDAIAGRLINQVELPWEDPNAYSAIALNGARFARSNTNTAGIATIELWNLDSGIVTDLGVPSAENEPLRFSANGKLLAAISESNLYIWSVSTGRLVHQGKLGVAAGGLAFSPNGEMTAVWDGEKGKAALFDSEQIARLALESGGVRPATATPATQVAPATPTAEPALTVIIPTPEMMNAHVIEATNAGSIRQKAMFGEGTINRASWSRDGGSVLIAGSLGASAYSASLPTGELSANTRWRLGGQTASIVESPDGRKLATGVEGDHVYVRDLTSGNSLAVRPGGGEPVISPDGNLLAYTNPDGYLELWDIPGGRLVATLIDSCFYSTRPVFSPDGQRIAAIESSASRLRYDDSIRIWDARTGAIVNALGGPDNDITDFSFSADGKFVVGAAGGAAWIWSIEPGKAPIPIRLYEAEINGNLNLYVHTVTAVALSADGRAVAVGTSENFIRLYDRRTLRPISEIKGSSSPSRELHFSPDGKTLLSVDEDRILSLWDTASKERLANLETYNGAINGLLFRTDGDLAAWESGTALDIRPSSQELISRTHVSSGRILAASPRGDLLAVTELLRVSLRDAQTGVLLSTLEGQAEEDPFVDYQFEGLVFPGFWGAAFSPDGGQLAAAGTGGIWYYDVKSRHLLNQLEGTNARRLTFSPDGTRLLSSLHEQAQWLTVFDFATGESQFHLDSGNYDMASHYPQFAFSPDGHWIAAVKTNWDSNNELLIFEAATGKVARRLAFAKGILAISVAVSPSGGLVAVGQADGKITLVGMSNMQIVSTLGGHRGPITQLVFSPDGQNLISASTDGTIRTWGLP